LKLSRRYGRRKGQGARCRDAGGRDSGRAVRRDQQPGVAQRRGIYSIAVSRDAVLIALHPLQRKTLSAVLVAVAGSLPTYAVGTPQTSHLGGVTTGSG
jgi:hypothetical protein